MWMIKFLALGLLFAVDAAVNKKAVEKAAKEAPAEKKISEHASTIADRSANLAFNLYQTMAKDKDVENILLSPVVVASSLGLVNLGGKASTAAQAKAVLSVDKLSDDLVHAGLAELLNEISNSTVRNVTWKIGNRLYGPSSISFSDDFVKNSKKHYNYEHSKINFRDKRSALKSINEWASQTTDGKLPEVTSDVAKTDGALIVNAMFFKPHWDEKFHHKMVDNRGFMVTRSFTVAVPMMHRTGLYNYYEDETHSLQILEMPLAHKLSSMVFIMPYHVEPMERVEKLLTREQVKTWLGKMQRRAVAVSLPKVSLEVSHDLQEIFTLHAATDVSGACAVKVRLKVRQMLPDLAGKKSPVCMRGSDNISAPATCSAGAANPEDRPRGNVSSVGGDRDQLPTPRSKKHLGELGLTEAIDKTKADFSKISGKKDLYLASLFHATALEWDTDGNPFDADIYSREELKTPKLFYADHPYVFLIKDNKTDSILFIGRLVRPKGDKMRDEL